MERDNPAEGVDSWQVGAIPDADVRGRWCGARRRPAGRDVDRARPSRDRTPAAIAHGCLLDATDSRADPGRSRGDPVFDLHRGGKMEIASTRRRSTAATTCRWPTRRASRGCARRSPPSPALVDDYTWVSNTVAVVTDGTAVLGLGDIGPGGGDAGDGGQGGPVQAVRRRGRRADLPGHHRTPTRSSRPSSGSRRASAASTSRTSRRRAASRSSSGSRSCSTSRSSTTTSTARRSWRSPRCENALRLTGRTLGDRARRDLRRRRGRRRGRPDPARGRASRDLAVTDRRGVLHSAPRRPDPGQAGARRATPPTAPGAPARWPT